ncbi:MAG TPA: ATP-dependent helicase, partial [Longimicrobiales bacterium]
MVTYHLPDWLSEAQRGAILSPASRLQIVAGAGSGKTEVLARRVVRLIVEGVDPASVIAFTFTEKAAAELKARIETRAAEADERFRTLPPAGRGLFVGTTHAWALRALQELGGAYELTDALTEEQEWALVHRVARRLGVVELFAECEGREAEKVAAAPAVAAFLRSAEVVHNERLDLERVRAAAPRFAEVLERYEWLLGEMRLMPFRLMIARAADELAPGGRLHERLRGRIGHVFVDEYQDFNRAQQTLLERLAALGADVTVVGDDDQAIYQWRGGDVSLFLSFAQQFPDAERVELGENHRCRPEIVQFARGLAESLARRLPKQLAAAREPAPMGAVELLPVAGTPADEARLIADRIRELIADGHAPGDIAVLFRSTRTSARPLVEALRARGIPVQVVGHTSLLARPEMALIARILVYWSGGRWYPNREYQVEFIRRETLEAEIRDVVGLDAEQASAALDALDRLGERLRQHGVPDIIAVFNEVLEILGLPGKGDEGAAREPGLGQMSELLTAFDHVVRRAAPDALYREADGPGADEGAEDATIAADREDGTPRVVLGASRGEIYLMRLRAFLEEFAGRAAEEVPAQWEDTAGAVQVLTIHQAKGLEFPIVFVPSLVEGRLPSSRLGQPQEWYLPDALFDRARYEGEEEDEARLLYVALTRAKELLVVSWFERYDG